MKFWQPIVWAETEQLCEIAVFESLVDSGMTSGLSMPFSYTLGTRSSLDDKKKMMEQFAEDIIRHF